MLYQASDPRQIRLIRGRVLTPLDVAVTVSIQQIRVPYRIANGLNALGNPGRWQRRTRWRRRRRQCRGRRRRGRGRRARWGRRGRRRRWPRRRRRWGRRLRPGWWQRQRWRWRGDGRWYLRWWGEARVVRPHIDRVIVATPPAATLVAQHEPPGRALRLRLRVRHRDERGCREDARDAVLLVVIGEGAVIRGATSAVPIGRAALPCTGCLIRHMPPAHPTANARAQARVCARGAQARVGYPSRTPVCGIWFDSR